MAEGKALEREEKFKEQVVTINDMMTMMTAIVTATALMMMTMVKILQMVLISVSQTVQ